MFNLKKLYFLNEDKKDKRYKSHTFLNIGQALHDLRYMKDIPGTKTKTDAIKDRAKSIATNLFYAAIDPYVHHDKDDRKNFDKLDEKEPEEWLESGAAEVVVQESKEIPDKALNKLPPFMLKNKVNKLNKTQLDVAEKTLKKELEKLGYPKERIILILLSVIDELID